MMIVCVLLGFVCQKYFEDIYLLKCSVLKSFFFNRRGEAIILGSLETHCSMVVSTRFNYRQMLIIY